MHPRTLRIIDANLNRICEGLRVLEDVARFVNDDRESSRQYKTIRHDLRRAGGKLGISLEKSRDAAHDIGSDFDMTHQHQDYTSIIRANSKRVEEGLRVLEELSKLPDMAGLLAGEELKKHRYAVYTLSQALILSTLHSSSSRAIHGLYAIIKCNKPVTKDLLPFCEEAISAGAGIIALSGKLAGLNTSKSIEILNELKQLCANKQALFVLHDHIDLALSVKPHGICLENSAVESDTLRKALPENTLTGKHLHQQVIPSKSTGKGFDFLLVSGGFAIVKKITGMKAASRNILPALIAVIDDPSTLDVDELGHSEMDCVALDISLSENRAAINKIRNMRERIENKEHL